MEIMKYYKVRRLIKINKCKQLKKKMFSMKIVKEILKKYYILIQVYNLINIHNLFYKASIVNRKAVIVPIITSFIFRKT